MFAASLCLARLEAVSAEGAIRSLARALFQAGHVRSSFEAAAVTRERRMPTGLPFEGIAVALPHAEPEHVVSPAMAIASLAKPVKFRQMGSPATQLEVELVLMPALTAKEQAAAGLAGVIELLQDESLRRALVAAPSPEAMNDAITAALSRRGGRGTAA
jgi:PTS system galactitol-specific IIA component